MSIGTSTYIPKADERDRNRTWFVVDARDVVLGKLATKVASVLRGKHKPSFTPFLDTGDHVVVVNARHVHVTGNKETNKLFHRHTGYLGNLKTANVATVRTKQPARLIEDAVRGMLPKTPLGRAMIKKLRVYADGTHQHQAQNPKPLAIK
jgi:large subunit ribosomal protein L13